MKLSDKQQALLMFAAFVLPPLATWMGLGFPVGNVELGILGSSMVGGIIAGIKELMGGKPQEAQELHRRWVAYQWKTSEIP